MLSSRLARGLAPLVIGVPCVVVVAIYGELSGQALLAVGATGVAVAVLGMVTRAGAGSPPAGRGARPWLVWVVVAGAWELAALASPLPTLSDLADVVLAAPPLRAAATVGWLLAGGWLLTRPTAPEGP